MNRIKTPRDKYMTARANLMMMVLLTCVNIILIIANSDYNFPFSAFLPQLFIYMGMNRTPDVPAYSATVSVILIALGALILLFFMLSYLFSKKKAGWMITALVLFSIDSLVFLILIFQSFEASFFVEILFHVWVMYYLIIGVKYSDQAIFEEASEEISLPPIYNGISGNETDALENSEAKATVVDSKSLGFPVEAKKEKILLNVSSYGMEIQVRRTRRLIELIINGNVYAKKDEGLIQQNYRIGALLHGHNIETEFSNNNQILYIDHLQVARKIRFV